MNRAQPLWSLVWVFAGIGALLIVIGLMVQSGYGAESDIQGAAIMGLSSYCWTGMVLSIVAAVAVRAVTKPEPPTPVEVTPVEAEESTPAE